MTTVPTGDANCPGTPQPLANTWSVFAGPDGVVEVTVEGGGRLRKLSGTFRDGVLNLRGFDAGASNYASGYFHRSNWIQLKWSPDGMTGIHRYLTDTTAFPPNGEWGACFTDFRVDAVKDGGKPLALRPVPPDAMPGGASCTFSDVTKPDDVVFYQDAGAPFALINVEGTAIRMFKADPTLQQPVSELFVAPMGETPYRLLLEQQVTGTGYESAHLKGTMTLWLDGYPKRLKLDVVGICGA